MPDDTALMAAGSVQDAALSGLLQARKTLPAKLFYDEEGCRLFCKITQLPEYYLTRTERGLLAEIGPKVAGMIARPSVLVEYGASDESKAEFLLREGVFSAYVPIDVAVPQLSEMRSRLRLRRPELIVWPLAADFMDVVALPSGIPELPRLGFFPGSTIGNLDPPEARRFLQRARYALGADAAFLVGVDLRKDPAVLVPAYDDSQGITAAFNRNLLTRLNREAAADFNLEAFAHRAVWNEASNRIEMHLVSLRDQAVHIGGEVIGFRRGETIHTENSYKYTPEGFATLAETAGWHSVALWTDPARLFSLHFLAPRLGL